MTIEVKLILVAIGLFTSLVLYGERVNEFLHGENNWLNQIEETPYYDYQQSRKEETSCLTLHCPSL